MWGGEQLGTSLNSRVLTGLVAAALLGTRPAGELGAGFAFPSSIPSLGTEQSCPRFEAERKSLNPHLGLRAQLGTSRGHGSAGRHRPREPAAAGTVPRSGLAGAPALLFAQGDEALFFTTTAGAAVG